MTIDSIVQEGFNLWGVAVSRGWGQTEVASFADHLIDRLGHLYAGLILYAAGQWVRCAAIELTEAESRRMVRLMTVQELRMTWARMAAQRREAEGSEN